MELSREGFFPQAGGFSPFLLLCFLTFVISSDCLIHAGKPQRTNGKIHGNVHVGNSPSPVEFTGNDLHSYVVVNEGRSYVAISEIPNSLGPSLLPLVAIGATIGWAFALEQPGFTNGFSIIGEGKAKAGEGGVRQASIEKVKSLASGSPRLLPPRALSRAAALPLADRLNSPRITSAEREGSAPGFSRGVNVNLVFPFSAGGEFTRQVEVTFQPGNEKLTVRQEFKGIDEHDHLVMSTTMEGRIPEVPYGTTVKIQPYSEIYHYSNSREQTQPSLRRPLASRLRPRRDTSGRFSVLPPSDHLLIHPGLCAELARWLR